MSQTRQTKLALVAIVVFVAFTVIIGAALWNIEKERKELVVPPPAPPEKPTVAAAPAPTPAPQPPTSQAPTATIQPSTPPTAAPEEPPSDLAMEPSRTGFKVRKAPITEADEYYLMEYTDDKVKGAQPAPELVQGQNTAWKLKLNASVCGKPVVHGDNLYFACYDRQIFVVETATGKVVNKGKLWYQPIGNPQLFKNTVVFPQRNGQLTAFKLGPTLESTWSSRLAVEAPPGKLDISISGAVVLGDYYLYASKHWGNLYILNAATGDMLADPGVSYESRINTPAVLYNGDVIYGNVAGELLCFSADGKKKRWQTQLPKGYALSLAVESYRLFCTTTEKELVALDLRDRKVLWTTPLNGYGFNSLILKGNRLFVAAGGLYAIDPAKGTVLWRMEDRGTWGFCRGPIVVEGDRAWGLSQEGRLVEFAPTTGAMHRSLQLGAGEFWNPLLKSGDLLIASSTGKEILGFQP